MFQSFFKLFENPPPRIRGFENSSPLDVPDCMMDNHTVYSWSTFNNDEQKIIFNSDTVENNFENNVRYVPGRTNCAWTYSAYLRNARYFVSVKKFEIPGCNDCNCGSLDIYELEGAWRPGKLLARVCGHNITKNLSFRIHGEVHKNSPPPPDTILLIHFKSNINHPKKLEIDVSSKPIKIYGKKNFDNKAKYKMCMCLKIVWFIILWKISMALIELDFVSLSRGMESMQCYLWGRHSDKKNNELKKM